jgi:hypothetical protein
MWISINCLMFSNDYTRCKLWMDSVETGIPTSLLKMAEVIHTLFMGCFTEQSQLTPGYLEVNPRQ